LNVGFEGDLRSADAKPAKPAQFLLEKPPNSTNPPDVDEQLLRPAQPEAKPRGMADEERAALERVALERAVGIASRNEAGESGPVTRG